MRADLDQVRDALSAYLDAPGLLHICSTEDWSGQSFPTSEGGLDLALKLVGELDERGAAGIYARGTTLKGELAPVERTRPDGTTYWVQPRGDADDSRVWLAVRLDLDHGKIDYAPDADTVREIVDDSSLPEPTWWVDSGHGLYPEWHFAEPVPDSLAVRELVRDVHGVAAAAFGRLLYSIDPGVTDAARVWRIPGTVNRKGAEVLCQYVDCSHRVYSLDELRGLVEHVETEPERPASQVAPRSDRLFTRDQAREYLDRYGLAPLRAAVPGERNTRLNQAAVCAGHFVPAFATADRTRAVLRKIAADLGLEPSEVEATIASGLRAGMAEPYSLSIEPVGDSDIAESPDDRLARKVAERVEWLQIEQLARAEVARLGRAEHLSIESGLVDDLDSIEPPAMLMESLIPEAAIGFLAGKSGAYKSFLAASWACCIATGRPWLGEERFAVSRPLKVLYVAAEGASGVAGRIKAWEASPHGTSRRGRLLLHPRPIHLNDEHRAAELGEVIAAHGIGFLVVDTYHRSAPGTEENSATEFGRVYEAVARLRDEHGIGVLFVDHTGAAKSGNPRGTSAKRDDSDYVLSVSYPGEEAGPAAQRELWVTKLKDESSSGRWSLRLAPVLGQHFPVIELGSLTGADPVALDHAWLGIAQARTPSVVRALDGKVGAAAVDIWRVLAFNGGQRGMTRAEIERVLVAAQRDAPGYKRPSVGSFGRALTELLKCQAMRPGETDARWVAADPDAPGKIVTESP